MAQPYPSHSVPTPPDSSRIAAILAHLSAPIAAVLSAGLLSLLGPLLVWLIKKDDPFARRAAAGAFNFNLLFWVLFLLSWLLIITVIGVVFAVPLMLVLFVWSPRGATSREQYGRRNNQTYDYPFQFRVLT